MYYFMRKRRVGWICLLQQNLLNKSFCLDNGLQEEVLCEESDSEAVEIKH